MITADIKLLLKNHSARLRELHNQRSRRDSELSEVQYRKSAIRASGVSDMPRSGAGWSDPLPALLDREQRILNELAELDSLRDAERAEVERIIALLDKAVERDVLRARYIDGMTWVRAGVAIGYSREQAIRFHGNALQNILRKMKVDTP